jgi:hypothetical protein
MHNNEGIASARSKAVPGLSRPLSQMSADVHLSVPVYIDRPDTHPYTSVTVSAIVLLKGHP